MVSETKMVFFRNLIICLNVYVLHLRLSLDRLRLLECAAGSPQRRRLCRRRHYDVRSRRRSSRRRLYDVRLRKPRLWQRRHFENPPRWRLWQRVPPRRRREPITMAASDDAKTRRDGGPVIHDASYTPTCERKKRSRRSQC